MATTDENGVVFYEEGDLFSPVHTALNLQGSALSEIVSDLKNSVEDSGWVTSGYSTVSGVTIGSFEIRRIGSVVQVRVVATLASLTIPTHGDITNTTLCTVPEAFRPAHVGSLGSSGVWRTASGVVLAGSGNIQLTGVAPDATQTGPLTHTNVQLSLGGVYFLD